MLAEQKLKAGQKENGARQSARSSANTYIRMRVHGQMYLFRFVSRCKLSKTHCFKNNVWWTQGAQLYGQWSEWLHDTGRRPH